MGKWLIDYDDFEILRKEVEAQDGFLEGEGSHIYLSDTGDGTPLLALDAGNNIRWIWGNDGSFDHWTIECEDMEDNDRYLGFCETNLPHDASVAQVADTILFYAIRGDIGMLEKGVGDGE